MSSETWNEIWALVALLPWIGFPVTVLLFRLLELRDDGRSVRSDDRAASLRTQQRDGRRQSMTL